MYIAVQCICMTLCLKKRASDPFTDGCEPPRGYWELNSGPPEEQSVLLTTEPSLQPPGQHIFDGHLCCMYIYTLPSYALVSNGTHMQQLHFVRLCCPAMP